MIEGRIIKGIGGFYYIETENKILSKHTGKSLKTFAKLSFKQTV